MRIDIGALAAKAISASSLWLGTRSLLLDGFDEHATLGPLFETWDDYQQDITVFLRFKMVSLVAGNNYLVMSDDHRWNHGPVEIWVRDTGYLGARLTRDDGAGAVGGSLTATTATGAIVAGTWYAAQIVYRPLEAAVSDRLKIFVDGADTSAIVSVSGSTGAGTPLNYGDDVLVGARRNIGNTAYERYANCNIRDLSFWHDDLTAYVSELYNAGDVFDISGATVAPVDYVEFGASGDSSASGSSLIQDIVNDSNNGTTTNTQADSLELDIP